MICRDAARPQTEAGRMFKVKSGIGRQPVRQSSMRLVTATTKLWTESYHDGVLEAGFVAMNLDDVAQFG